MRKFFLFLLLAFAMCLQTTTARTIKILAIGNSFSEDAIEQYLHELADADGIETVIGNLFIGGCSLERHMQCVNDNSPSYRYRKIGVDGVMKETPNCDIAKAIADEDWDYVSVQQASHFSGDYNTYQPYISQLVAYVKHIQERREDCFSPDMGLCPKLQPRWLQTLRQQSEADV